MSAILLDQEIVHYEVLGRGRPLIFLHGWVGSWRYWIPVMQAATMSFRAYAVDLWGFGDSAHSPRKYTLEQQARLLDGFMNEMGMGRVALIGHGLGALVAELFARQHAEIVDRVMLVGCPLDESMVNARLRSAAPADLADWLLGRDPLNDAARSDALKTDPAAVTASFSGMAALKDYWRNMPTACLLVNGQNDPAVEAPRLDQLADLPEHTHAVAFEQSGHFPMLEEGSKFSRLMSDFLTLPSGESPRVLQLKEEWKRRVR